MKEQEQKNRNKLKENKPEVYSKIKKYEKDQRPLIQLQYNYKCNFKCEHCSIDKVKNKDRRSLTPEDVKNIFTQADNLGFSRTTITGGEPLGFSDFDELVEAIDPKKFWISVDTNCWFLTQEKAHHLKKIGIDRLQPSLDYLTKEEHDKFRRKDGSHQKCLDSIDFAKNADLAIFIQTVVGHNRLHSQEFIDYLKFFNGKDVGVFVSFAKPVGAWENNFNDLIIREDLDYFENLEKEYNVFSHLTSGYGLNEERNCVASKNIFSITQYGDVIPCPYCYISMGNLFEEDFETIYRRSSSLNVFRKDTCLLAEDRGFIDKYLVKKIYGKELPIHWTEAFEQKDFD